MISKQLFRLLSSAAFLVLGNVSNAQQGCYATEIYEVQQGTRHNGLPITDPIRIDPTKTLGQPENNRSGGAANFFSLGEDGYIILKMGGAIVQDGTNLPDLRVYETTWGNPSCANYPEYAEISVSNDGEHFYLLGTYCQGPNISIDLDGVVPAGLQVSYVKVANVSTLASTDDFFDLDGLEALFGCEEIFVPIPVNCYASCMTAAGYTQGLMKDGSPIYADRTNPLNAIGEPQSNDTVNFVTLGYGGSLELCFDGPILNGEGDDLFVVETSFYNVTCSTYKEYADIEVSIDGNTWYYIGTGCLDFGVDISDASVYLPYVNYVRIKNNDTLSLTPDGFDVDAVVVLHGNCQLAITALAAYLSTPDSEARMDDFIAYPNPTKGELNFNFNVALSGKVALELFNINGQKVATVYEGEASAGSLNQVSYNTSNLPNGMYLTRLTTDDGVMTGKIMVAK